MLLEHRYALYFGTRSSSPRIWFSLRDDVLYLDRLDEDVVSPLLDSGNYNVGQFLPEDLRAVRRLAPGGCGFHPDRLTGEESDVLRLLPGIEESFFVLSNLNELAWQDWSYVYLRGQRQRRR